MERKIMYMAIDGKLFNDDQQCKIYEASLQGENGKDFCFYDKDFNKVDIVQINTFSSSELYNTYHVCYIHILTDKGVNALKSFSIYMNRIGIYEYQSAYYIKNVDDVINEYKRKLDELESVKERLGD